MPYIPGEKRPTLDTFIEPLVDILRSFPDDLEGTSNYTITRIIAGAMRPSGGWRYKSLNAAHGTFYSAANEFYDRLMRNHEDKAIAKNGDVKEYANP